MKKRLIMIMISVMLAVSFTACAKEDPDEVVTGDENDDETDEDDNDGDNETDNDEGKDIKEPSQKEPVENINRVLGNDEYRVYLIDGDKPVLICDLMDKNGYISSARLIGNYIYVVASNYDSSRIELTVYDCEGNLLDTPYTNKNSVYLNVADYKDRVYIDAYDYSSDAYLKSEVLIYDPETKKCSRDNELQDVENKIRENNYTFLISGENSLLRTLEDFKGRIYAKDDSGRILELDPKTGDTMKEVLSVSGSWYAAAVSGDYIWVNGYNEDNLENYCAIYNLKNADKEVLYSGPSENRPEVVCGKNGIFYGYNQKDAYFHPDRQLFMYNAASRKMDILLDEKEKPGLSGYYYSPFMSGVTVTDSDYYYLSDYDNKIGWKRYNFADKKVYDTNAFVHEYGWSEFAQVDAKKDIEYYPDNQEKALYKFYLEIVTIKDDVPNADKINKTLRDIDDIFIAASNNHTTVDVLDPQEGDYWYSESNERTLNDIYRIGSHYLVINYDGYDYFGGAHGMPYRIHLLFDLNTGDQTGLEELCDMNDSSFKNLVAMKTVEDWKNGDNYYYNSYEDNPDYQNELFEEAKEYADMNMSVNFLADGIEVEYPPYYMGPYASGYICVFISYEELGIDINN